MLVAEHGEELCDALLTHRRLGLAGGEGCRRAGPGHGMEGIPLAGLRRLAAEPGCKAMFDGRNIYDPDACRPPPAWTTKASAADRERQQ